jgi:CheY-like chemotaxis protein
MKLSKPASILLVEDDPLVASAIEEILVDAGLTIAAVSSAAAALALAEATAFRLALVDIRLAGALDGIELACLLRDKHAIPTIFLSDLHQAETLERSRAATPLGFLQKPLRPAQMFNAIEQAFAG